MKKEVSIIYEDNHLLVVEKPPNILSQADDTGDQDLLTLLKEDIKERYNKPGNVYLGLVHRLDRPVGGVMVFAKTSKAASRLSDQIRKREFKKVYLAVINGVPEKTKASLRHFLYKDSKTNRVSVVSSTTEGAKEALLDYEVVQSTGRYSLVKVHLHTGRPHQIRVQLAALGYPLYGDQKYGSYINKPNEQIALWSHEINCVHPTLQKAYTFTSKPPKVEPWNWF